MVRHGRGAVMALLALVVLASPARAEEARKWSIDVPLYVLFAGMDGQVASHGHAVNLDVEFSDVMEHLEFGAMGSVRVGYERWRLTTEIIYMGLGAAKEGASADMDQWVVEPRVSYRFPPFFEPFVGVRYNKLSGSIEGPFGKDPIGTQDWFDPILGTDATFAATTKLDVILHADIGGFGAGSDLTWQLFPYVSWQVTGMASLLLGYRLLDVDYESDDESGFEYNVLTQGFQLGGTFHF